MQDQETDCSRQPNTNFWEYEDDERDPRSSKVRKKQEIIKQLEHISYIPSKDNIFRMFDILPIESIKVVIIGQDPYPSHCKVTKKYYACGPAFLIPDDVVTCPVSLKKLFSELKKDYDNPVQLSNRISIGYIRKCVKYWISQGVFLTNVALTIGTEGTYLDNHKMFWKEFSISFIKKIAQLNCPIVLLGKDAWELSSYITTNSPVLKFHHPASRSNSFDNSKMFTRINSHLESKIKWYF
jgi:uracil-DNA glycosylase